jgi:Lar family restriction alleviation protein
VVKWVVEQEQAVLPCPFCGSGDVRVDEHGTVRRRRFVVCWGCGATGPSVADEVSGSEAEALRQWNRRGR